MGLDIALGVVVLLGAIRGWFRGFLLPAIRLGGLVGSAFAAAPIRDLARPHVAPYLATIRPDLLDRMLWWAGAAVAYVAVVGLSGLALALQRRKPAFGEPDDNRADQFAGLLLGGAKAAVLMAFLVAGLDRFARDWAHTIPWADHEAKTSQALAWNEQYRPADRIWASPPVRRFVAHVRRMGISGPDAAEAEMPDPSPLAEAGPTQAASGRTPRLSLPPASDFLDPEADDFLPALDRALNRLDRDKPRH